jgi:hypothetical protein
MEFQIIVFVLSMVMAILLRPKPGKRDANQPGSWTAQTIQAEDVPIEHCLGYVPVEGNLFSPWTEVVNTTVPVNLIRALAIYGIVLDPEASNLRVTRSEHRLNCCLAFGDGPNVGLLAGSTLNDKPLADWTDVTTVERLGTDLQAGTGVVDRFEIAREEKVAIGAPVTVIMPDKDYANIAIVIGSLEGLVGYGSDGHLIERKITCKIEIRAVGGAWHILFDYHLFAATAAPVRWLFTADGTYDGGTPFAITPGAQHEWKVTCSAIPAETMDQGQLYVLGVQEIYDVQSVRPGLHYLAVSAISKDSLSGALRFKGIVQGKILESIAGGTFAFSRNPAVAMKWAWTRPVICGDGDGTPWYADYYRGYAPAKLTTDDFTAYETWCNEDVPDGKGGTEVRFEFDGRFIDPEEAWSQAVRIGAMSHAVTWLQGNQIRVYVDQPCTPTRIFCDGNMLKGSYRETPVKKQSLPGAIKATIVNAASGYVQQTVLVVDSLATTDRVASISGFGHSSVSQLIRWARRFFDRGRYHDLDFTWRTGPCGLDAQKGETAYIQSDRNGRCLGGRVVDSPEALKVAVNHNVSIVPGTAYRLILQTIDDDGMHVVNYKVASLDDARTVVVSHYLDPATGEDVELEEDLLYTPVQNDVWIYGAEANIQMARITGQSPEASGNCSFTAEQYREEYYTRDDEPPDYDTAIYIADAKPKRSTFDPVTRDELRTAYGVEKTVDGDNIDQVTAGGILFAAAGGGAVGWTCTGRNDLGWVRYQGDSYPIEEDAAGTTDTYIYFDPATGVLEHTNDLDDLRGEERFLACVNLSGVPYPQNWQRIGENDTSLDWSLVTGAGKPEDNADVTADHPISQLRETFEDPNGDFATRWVSYNPAACSIVAAAGVAGGNILRCGDNSGDDRVNLTYYHKIPYDPSKLYRIRVRVRTTAGSGKLYLGIYGYNVSGAGLNPTASTAHWVCAFNRAVPSDWTVYTGYFMGHSAAGTAVEAPSPAAPGALKTGVAYFTVFAHANYNTAGITDFDEISVDIMPETGDFVNFSGTTAPAQRLGATWLNTNWCGQDCVAHWRLNDNAANTHVKDESPNANHGTAQQNTSALTAAGKVGAALTFNGSTDKIVVPSAASVNFGTGDFSGCAWIKTSYSAADQTIITKRTAANVGFDFLLRADGDLGLLIGDGTATYLHRAPAASLRDGAWHFVGFTVDRNGNSYFYIGGALSTAMDFTARSGSISNTEDLHLGIYRDAAANPWNGALDNIMLFDRALTKDDFDALYDAGTGTELIGLGSTRMLHRSDGTYWLLADSDSPTIPRSAAEVPETSDRKWAAESGADITGSHTAAAITGQGDLATLDEVDTDQVTANAITQLVFVESSASLSLIPSPISGDGHGKRCVVEESAEFASEGYPLFINLFGRLAAGFASDGILRIELFHRRSDDASGGIDSLTLSGTDPVKITTAAAHGLSSTNQVWIDGMSGGELNDGIFTITVLNATQFTLNNTRSDWFIAATGGTVKRVTSISLLDLSVMAGQVYALFGDSCLYGSLTAGKTYQILATIRNTDADDFGTHGRSTLTIMEVKR